MVYMYSTSIDSDMDLMAKIVAAAGFVIDLLVIFALISQSMLHRIEASVISQGCNLERLL